MELTLLPGDLVSIGLQFLFQEIDFVMKMAHIGLKLVLFAYILDFVFELLYLSLGL